VIRCKPIGLVGGLSAQFLWLDDGPTDDGPTDDGQKDEAMGEVINLANRRTR
jgi:hypothetical protein